MILTAAAAYITSASRMNSSFRAGAMHSVQKMVGNSTTSLFGTIKQPKPVLGRWGTHIRRAGAEEGSEEGSEAKQGQSGQAQGRGFLGGVGDMISPSASEFSTKSSAMSIPMFTLALLIFAVYYVGLVTFWSRANPTAPPGLRVFAYLMLLLFGEFYLIYVVFRFAFFGISRRTDVGYASLHKPTPYLFPSKGSSAAKI